MKAFSRYCALSSVTLTLLYGVACGDEDSAPSNTRGGRGGGGGRTGAGGVLGSGGAGGTIGASGTSGTGGTSGAGGAVGGASGTSGSAGAGGTNGASGSAGAGGTNGASGSAGRGGTNGASGSAGAGGTAGLDGSVGTGGTAGLDGSTGSGGSGQDASAGTGGTNGAAGTNGASGTNGTGGTNGTAGTGGTNGTAGTGGTNGTAGTGGTAGSDGGGAGPTIPTPTGTCPTFSNNTVTFSPAGTAQRSVRIWINATAAASMDGPIVLFWYPTGGSPNSATSSLGSAGINRIINAGGIVAAPTHINCGTFPWICGGDVDVRLTDEILACAKATGGPGFDSRRIHSLGFSAGALYTTSLSYRRSSYFASVATYSGGGTGTFQENNNKFAALIFHGGSGDSVAGANFQTLSQQWQTSLKNAQHFAPICNHNGGHTIPQGGPAAIVQFFFDHPYGTNPSPYATTFPSTIPSYCTR